MIKRNGRLRVPFDDREEMPPPPEVVTLPLHIPGWRLPGLSAETGLLLANPSESGCSVRPRHVDPRIHRRHERDVTVGRMHCEVNVPHRLLGQLDHHVPELDRRHSQ
jgi:hypothetical protein